MSARRLLATRAAPPADGAPGRRGRPRPPHGAGGGSRLTETPSSKISPASGGSSSRSGFSGGDLPQRDGPATATNSPGITSTSTPWSTGTGRPSGPWNVLARPRARTSTPGAPPSGPPPDGLGGRGADDPEGGGGGGERAQDDREAEREAEQARRKEEELLALPP